MYYFDNAATSFPKAKGLSKYIENLIDNNCVNINRGVYSKSSQLEDDILSTRIKLAEFFDIAEDIEKESKRVIFTSGVTASINMFLRGTLKKGNHIITGAMEHHAVMRTLYDLKEKGIEYSVAPVDKNGIIIIDKLESLIKENTKAIIVSHASNVFGSVNDIEKIGEICRNKDIFFAVDSAQTAGVIDISTRNSNIDFLAFSGHKGLLGLQGVGGFVISDKLLKEMNSTVTGGTGSRSTSYIQPDFLPDKYESGTLNILGILSIGYALDYIKEIGVENIRKHEIELRKLFIDLIKDNKNIIIYCDDLEDDKVTATVSLSIKNKDNAQVSYSLSNDYDIMIRQGIQCSAQAHQTMGTIETGTIRFSFGFYNSKEEIKYAANALCELAK